MSVRAKILELTRSFYPTGRAFKMPKGGVLEKLHDGLAISEERAYLDAMSILNSILPDNAGFTAADATAWEVRLGMITNNAVPLADRKAAIIRKMNHPGTIKARQYYLYVEAQLRAAGFDVYVYENRFALYPDGYETKTPEEVSGTTGQDVQYGDVQYGDAQMGDAFFEKVVNAIDEDIDLPFNIGTNLRSTFFIGGSPVGTFANVDVFRKKEFRQLILKIKPAQTVAFLFINYV